MSEGVSLYICPRCKKTFEHSEFLVLREVRCPHCGFRVVAKARSGRIKTLKAI